ncbi:MAG: ABC transporter permease, partial [Dehalococcoidia bacterium]
MDKTGIAARAEERVPKKRRELPLWIAVWGQVVKEKPLAAVGLAIIAVLFFVGIFAHWLAPEGFNEPHQERLELIDFELVEGTTVEAFKGETGLQQTRYVGPSLSPFYPMGLDNLGRDLFSRIIYGARVSMIVAIGTVSLHILLAAVVGMTSAWFGGKIDTFIQRIVDAWMIFPTLVVLIVLVTTLPQEPPFSPFTDTSWGIFKVVLALALTGIGWTSRIIRSAAMAVREYQYVDAARALGASGWRINLRYILPNIMAPIITLSTLLMGFAIL